MKKIGIIRFLGTNCDQDVFNAVEDLGLKPHWLWFEDRFDSREWDGLILPGGFSYGDYLRCGALAAMAPVMASVHEAAEKGVPLLGICNGFQILCESRLLPGVLIRNEGRRFIDDWVELDGLLTNGFWKSASSENSSFRLPIAHGEGRFFHETPQKLYDNNQVLCRYKKNPTGTLLDIAGLTNEAGNVCALMPHPERAIHNYLGGTDGRRFFEALL